jgi:hypothetical protein
MNAKDGAIKTGISVLVREDREGICIPELHFFVFGLPLSRLRDIHVSRRPSMRCVLP